MQKVLITKQIPDIACEILEASGISVDIINPDGMTNDELKENFRSYNGVITMLADKVSAEVIESAPQLKVVANFAVGFNNIDVESAKKNGVIVTNTPDVLTEATAELALTLLMATSRQIKAAQRFIANNEWKRWETIKFLGPSLNGKTLGIFGMGRIGESFAQKCEAALGMKVIYSNRNKKDSPYAYVTFEELLKESDVISIHCPLTDETKNRFNADAFSQMKSSSILINTARGEICHTEDLFQALKNKKIFAAGLDVTNPEPLAPEHPLYGLDNALILPHIGSATIEARNAMAKLVAQNVVNVLNGDSPITPVG